MSAYRVVYERDQEGWWVASVPTVPGCHSQARTLRGARARIREALSLDDDQARSAELIDDVRLPLEARRALSGSRHARERAERERSFAQASTRDAARLLTERFDLSVRDAAELLGLSHQRVQQLVAAPKS